MRFFSVDFLGPSFPLSEGLKIHREIHSKIHDKIPAKSMHVVKTASENPLCRKRGPTLQGLVILEAVPLTGWQLVRQERVLLTL